MATMIVTAVIAVAVIFKTVNHNLPRKSPFLCHSLVFISLTFQNPNFQ